MWIIPCVWFNYEDLIVIWDGGGAVTDSGWFRSWPSVCDKMYPLLPESFGLVRTSQCSPLGLPVACPLFPHLTLGLFSRGDFATPLGSVCSAFCCHLGKRQNSLSPQEQLCWQLDQMMTFFSSSLGGRRHFLPLWLAKYYMWPWVGSNLIS